MTRRLLVGVVLAVCTANGAAAQQHIGGGGGMFVPFEGNAGSSGLAQFLTTTGERFRLGGEIEYRGYSSQILDVEDVHIDTLTFRFLGQYLFRSDGIRPYLGVGAGLNLNIIDSGRVENQRSEVAVQSDVGMGVGVLGLAGIEIPLSDSVAVFGEGRVSADVQLTSDSEDIGAANLGGISAVAGLRIRFGAPPPAPEVY